MDNALLVVLLIVIAIAVLRRIIRWIRTYEWDKHTEQERSKQNKTSFLGLLGNFWPLIPAAAGGFKYIYEAWEKAAKGSPEKTKWALVLLLIAAAALRVAIWMIDKKINTGPAEAHDYESIPMETERIENG